MSTKKKPEIIRETIQAQHEFTDAEKQALGSELAGLVTSKSQIELEKKEVTSQFTARIAEKTAQISLVSGKLSSGIEMRPTCVIVEFDAKAGKKRFLSDDRKKTLVREEAMSPSDYERPLFKPEEINGAKPAKPDPADGKSEDVPPSVSTSVPEGFEIVTKTRSQEGDLAKNAHGEWVEVAQPGRKASDFIALARKIGTPAETPAKPEPENAGQTNLGERLDAAAAGEPMPKIRLKGDSTGLSAKQFKKEFSFAAGEVNWPEAAISVMLDVLDRCADVAAMHETLRPHIAEAQEGGAE